MARGKMQWNEKRITSMEVDGCGKGRGALYKPWIRVEDFSSLGRVRRVWSPKTARTHHLMSDVEFKLFLTLEWQTDISDIREQYPLDREMTQTVARTLGIRHPYYPGTHVPTVMTVDFLVTKLTPQGEQLIALNAKRDEEAEDENSLLKLEIQRDYFEQLDIPHHLVYHSQIPEVKVRNIAYIRDALLKEGEIEPRPGLFKSLCDRMANALYAHSSDATPLSKYCTSFDTRHGLEQGTGLRIARMLMQQRILRPNLAAINLEAEPLSSFITAPTVRALCAAGGM